MSTSCTRNTTTAGLARLLVLVLQQQVILVLVVWFWSRTIPENAGPSDGRFWQYIHLYLIMSDPVQIVQILRGRSLDA